MSGVEPPRRGAAQEAAALLWEEGHGWGWI
jgi:hypothetical protein